MRKTLLPNAPNSGGAGSGKRKRKNGGKPVQQRDCIGFYRIVDNFFI
jgi:hypothetical protein